MSVSFIFINIDFFQCIADCVHNLTFSSWPQQTSTRKSLGDQHIMAPLFVLKMSISINLDYTFNVVIHNRNLSASHELVKRHRKTIKTVQHFAQLIHRYVKTSLVYILGFIRIQSFLWLRARKIYVGAISRIDLAKNLVTY